MLVVFWPASLMKISRKDSSVTCLSKVVAGKPLASEYTTEVSLSFCVLINVRVGLKLIYEKMK